MKKIFFIILPLVFILSACTLGDKVTNTVNEVENDTGTLVNKATGVTDLATKAAADLAFAKARATQFYSSLKAQGEDLTNGPCLSDSLTTGWVADVVHNPREAVDDLPANQCPSFVNGTAKHFVELDLNGNFVRAK